MDADAALSRGRAVPAHSFPPVRGRRWAAGASSAPSSSAIIEVIVVLGALAMIDIRDGETVHYQIYFSAFGVFGGGLNFKPE